jgi:hypothetical protein
MAFLGLAVTSRASSRVRDDFPCWRVCCSLCAMDLGISARLLEKVPEVREASLVLPLH